jgi:4'-phosphopantetheinyl transferase
MMAAAMTPEVQWFDVRVISPGSSGLLDLGLQERARAAAFAFAGDRHRYQVAHALLRRVLAGHTGIPPARLRFTRQPCPRCGAARGRPALAGDGAPHFSMARSGDAIAIAVASVPVGIDIERIRPGCTCDLAGVMHGDDASRVARLPEPRRHAAILRWWVRAEAVLKCTGAGIAHGMADFPLLTVTPPTEAGASAAAGASAGGGTAVPAAGCRLTQLTAPPGYAAALALRS